MARRDPSISQTDWSMIGRVSSDDEDSAREAFDRLVRRYWPAVYAYIRRSGRSVHEASDLTQSFVAEVLMDRRLIHGADPSRGRFRNLLLVAVRNFLRESSRFQTRLKRAPRGAEILPIGTGMDQSATGQAETPDGAFEVAWCRTLVQVVFRRVREECQKEGLARHWRVFEARIVQPLLHGTAAVPFEALSREMGLESASQAANLQVTVKRRFMAALRAEIAATVGGADAVEDELRELLRIIGQ